jgi:hypothetical protein
MSFEIFVHCFDPGTPGIRRDALRELFPVVAAEAGDTSCSVVYDARNTTEIYFDHAGGEEFCRGLMFWRPCAHPQFWRDLFALVRSAHATVSWPGGGPVIAPGTDSSCAPLELGRVVVVTSGEELRAALAT